MPPRYPFGLTNEVKSLECRGIGMLGEMAFIDETGQMPALGGSSGQAW
jgi:hypothetical protein